jgi:hypothetical protein
MQNVYTQHNKNVRLAAVSCLMFANTLEEIFFSFLIHWWVRFENNYILIYSQFMIIKFSQIWK